MFSLAPHLQRRSRALVALALAAAGLGLAAQSAAAQTTTPYWVTPHAKGPYGLGPDVEQRISPALPDGVSLEGRVRCPFVFNDAGQSVIANGGSLDAGVYTFDRSRCTARPEFALSPESPARFTILPGAWIVTAAPTRLDASVAVNRDLANPSVGFSAAVSSTVGEAPPLPGQRIEFQFERADGFWELQACTAVSDPDQGIATCSLTGAAAERFLVGTGQWQAHYAATRNYVGSSTSGRVSGTATEPSAAAKDLQDYLNDPANQIRIEKVQLPAQCHQNPDQTNVSIIGVSIGILNCEQIKVVQILAGIAVGAMLGPGQATASAVATILENAAFLTAKIAAQQTAKVLLAVAVAPK